DKMEEEIQVYLDRIKEIGGAVQAVEEGFMQREIQQNAYETQKRIEKEEEIIVGLNKFKLDEEVNPDLLKVDEALEQAQIESIQETRTNRDQTAVDHTLAAIRKAAKTQNVNLIPFILDAVKVYATKEEKIIVGLNKFKLDEEVNPDLLKVDEALEQAQIESIQETRTNRDQTAVDHTLAAIRKAAKTQNVNLIPFILDAVKVYATIGE